MQEMHNSTPQSTYIQLKWRRFAGTVADLLDMEEQEIAQMKILPAALAGLTEAEDMAALEALASKVGLELPVLMNHYGHHAVAKFLYEGVHLFIFPAVAYD